MLGGPISSHEIKLVLKSFTKDKICGPNGWTLELSLAFFALMGNGILPIVQEAMNT